MRKSCNVTSSDISQMLVKISKLNEGKTMEDVNILISSNIITDLTVNGTAKKYEYNKLSGILKEISVNEK